MPRTTKLGWTGPPIVVISKGQRHQDAILASMGKANRMHINNTEIRKDKTIKERTTNGK
jgi:hypothetical protein